MSYQRTPNQCFEPEQDPLDALLTQPTSPPLSLQNQLGNAAVQDLIRSQQAGPAPAGQTATNARQPSWWDRAVDWVGEQADEQIDFGAGLVSGVPVLGAAANGVAAAEHFAVDAAAGFAKGAGDLVGGIGHMIAHPLDTAQGVGSISMHIPGTQLWLLNHFGPSNADQVPSADPTQTDASPQAPGVLAQDGEFWSQAGHALIEPYKDAIDNGKTGEAVGRGLFDLGSLFVGAGEVKATGEAGEAARALSASNKVDEPVKALNTLEQRASTADDLARAGNKAETWTKSASELDDAANLGMSDDATRLADETDEAARALRSQDEPAKLATATDDAMVAQSEHSQGGVAQTEVTPSAPEELAIVEVDEGGRISRQLDEGGKVAEPMNERGPLTSDATRQHVHRGGTVADPQSPYFGKWDGGGIHDWDGLVSRCAEDGYRVAGVAEDPVSGVRRVIVERRGVNPRDQRSVSGKIKKTLYPKSMTPEQIDLAGEEALQRAMQGGEGTKFEPFGGNLKRDGTLADGYFEAEVLTPSGQPVRTQGWFRETPDGQRIISSHAPCYEEAWPQLPQAEW